MFGDFAAKLAKLFEEKFVFGIEFISARHVVLVFANRTFERECDALSFFCHMIPLEEFGYYTRKNHLQQQYRV